MDTAPDERILAELPPAAASSTGRHEIAGYARYSINRVEGERGEHPRWDVSIGLSKSGYRTQIVLEQVGLTLETGSVGPDADLDVWDAMCRLEQMLRERRSQLACDQADAEPPDVD